MFFALQCPFQLLTVLFLVFPVFMLAFTFQTILNDMPKVKEYSTELKETVIATL